MNTKTKNILRNMFIFGSVSVLLVSIFSSSALKPVKAEVIEAEKNNKSNKSSNEIILKIGENQAVLNGSLVPIVKGNPAVKPFIDENNRTMIPLRFVSEAMGCEVGWNDSTREATVTTELNGVSITSTFKIGDRFFTISDVRDPIEMDTSAVIKDDSTFIPLRFLVEGVLSKKITWNENRLIGISDKENIFSADANSLLGFSEQNSDVGDLKLIGTQENLDKILAEYKENSTYYYGALEATANDMVTAEAELKREDIAFGRTQNEPAYTPEPAEAPAPTMKEESMADSGTGNSAGASHSETNTQVKGVDEADIIKTDGKNIYYIANNELYIIDAENPSQLYVKTQLGDKDFNVSDFSPREMFLDKNYLTIVGSNFYGGMTPYRKSDVVQNDVAVMPMGSNSTGVIVYDISDISSPKMIKNYFIWGSYNSSRKIDNFLYLSTTDYKYDYGYADQPQFRITNYTENGTLKKISLTNTYCFAEVEDLSITTLSGINLTNANAEVSQKSFMGSSSSTVYVSKNNAYLVSYEYNYNDNSANTKINKFKINNGQVDLVASNKVKGNVLNQYSMDEHNGYFRIATTEESYTRGEFLTTNTVTIMDENLNTVGKLEGLAPGEHIKSARFMGDKIYLITFVQIDPLFVIEAKDPTNPHVLGELKIPGYSDYLHPYDENHLIGFGYDTEATGNTFIQKGLKVSLFDVSDLNNPKEKFTMTIGDTGSYSSMYYNPKSLMIDESRDLYAFPVSLNERTSSRVNGMDYYGDVRFSGALVFEINPNSGINLKGQVSHELENNNYRMDLERIIYIKDTLFTTTHREIQATDLNTFKKLGSIELN